MESIRKSKIFIWVEVVSIIWGFLTIVYIILNAFGAAPDLNFVKKADIQPVVYLYPGSNVQLKPDFKKVVLQDELLNVDWTIKGKGKSTKITGPLPIVTLPPEGGIYDLKVQAKVRDKADMIGAGSIYIVQVEPQKVTATENLKVKVADTPLEAEEIEIYQGAGKSSEAKIEITEEGSFVNILRGQELQAVDGKVFFKLKDPRFEPASTVQMKEFKSFELPASMKTNLKN
ncbi:MAG: hypothetical protein KDD50_02630 [Bdellovibrionales bacterium]|nr:hypothetical protein [Bdellovibrionales bacterium]